MTAKPWSTNGRSSAQSAVRDRIPTSRKSAATAPKTEKRAQARRPQKTSSAAQVKPKPGIVMGTLPPLLSAGSGSDDDLDICPVCDSECTCSGGTGKPNALAASSRLLASSSVAPTPAGHRAGKATRPITGGGGKKLGAKPPRPTSIFSSSPVKAARRTPATADLGGSDSLSDVNISDWSSEEDNLLLRLSPPPLRPPPGRGAGRGKNDIGPPPSTRPVKLQPSGKKVGKIIKPTAAPPPPAAWDSELSGHDSALDASDSDLDHDDGALVAALDAEDLVGSGVDAAEAAAIQQEFAARSIVDGELSDHTSSTFGYDYSPSSSDAEADEGEMYDEIQFEVANPPGLATEETAATSKHQEPSNWSSAGGIDPLEYAYALGWESWASMGSGTDGSSTNGSDSSAPASPVNRPAGGPATPRNSPVPNLPHLASPATLSSDYLNASVSDQEPASRPASPTKASAAMMNLPITTVALDPFLPRPLPEPATVPSAAATLSSRDTVDYTTAPTPAPTPLHPTDALFAQLDLSYVDALIDQNLFLPDHPDALSAALSAFPLSMMVDDSDMTAAHRNRLALASLDLEVPGALVSPIRPQPVPADFRRSVSTTVLELASPAVPEPTLNDLQQLPPSPPGLASGTEGSGRWPTPAEAYVPSRHGNEDESGSDADSVASLTLEDPPPLLLDPVSPGVLSSSTSGSDPVPSLLETSVLMFKKKNRLKRARRKWGDGAPQLLQPSPGKTWVLSRARPAGSPLRKSLVTPTLATTQWEGGRLLPILDHQRNGAPESPTPGPLSAVIQIEDLMDTENLAAEVQHPAKGRPMMPTVLPTTNPVQPTMAASTADGHCQEATEAWTATSHSRWDHIPIHSFRTSRSQVGLRESRKSPFTYADALKFGARWQQRQGSAAPATVRGSNVLWNNSTTAATLASTATALSSGAFGGNGSRKRRPLQRRPLGRMVADALGLPTSPDDATSDEEAAVASRPQLLRPPTRKRRRQGLETTTAATATSPGVSKRTRTSSLASMAANLLSAPSHRRRPSLGAAGTTDQTAVGPSSLAVSNLPNSVDQSSSLLHNWGAGNTFTDSLAEWPLEIDPAELGLSEMEQIDLMTAAMVSLPNDDDDDDIGGEAGHGDEGDGMDYDLPPEDSGSETRDTVSVDRGTAPLATPVGDSGLPLDLRHGTATAGGRRPSAPLADECSDVDIDG
ncbi:hypothetical protein IWQ60_001618 [Tieghemiomyces parasiticus]|uniref:Uncharacterized protein n=1 Tax=Tieghemiomyces parasiticus TaxID=78921 RepID=A0A9W8AJJ9_9FUNG|nr:hypothetical protein IWQ60_001618 [Tieghemiomyces parasiticus]